MVLSKNKIFEKRQYYLVLALSIFITLIYFASIITVVAISTSSITRASPLVFVESMLDLLGSVSEGPFSFLFTILMNLVLIFFVMTMNVSSVVIAELIGFLNERRTGGRNTNELELNSLAMSRRPGDSSVRAPL